MKTHTTITIPPVPALRQEIEAFHLRERRLRATLALLACLVAATVCALLCDASTGRETRALLFGLFCMCSGSAGIYAYRMQEAHRALKKAEGSR